MHHVHCAEQTVQCLQLFTAGGADMMFDVCPQMTSSRNLACQHMSGSQQSWQLKPKQNDSAGPLCPHLMVDIMCASYNFSHHCLASR